MHFEFYLYTDTVLTARRARKMFNHLTIFIQSSCGVKKVKHTNVPMDLPPPPKNPYILRANTMAQRKIPAQQSQAACTPWDVCVVDDTWRFTGFIAKNRHHIEGLEGGWITVDGNNIGMDCDWTYKEPRSDDTASGVGNGFEAAQDEPHVDEAVDESPPMVSAIAAKRAKLKDHIVTEVLV